MTAMPAARNIGPPPSSSKTMIVSYRHAMENNPVTSNQSVAKKQKSDNRNARYAQPVLIPAF